jgi:aminoglycoside phosphotransferase family enzyme/predicted kinase
MYARRLPDFFSQLRSILDTSCAVHKSLEPDRVLVPDSPSPASDQARLVAALRSSSVFGDGCEHIHVLETHISYVLLTGKHAYKIKKSVRLGFLDFTTLAARRFYCEEELRLNRRLASTLYLDVVAITGTVDAPILGGDGPAIEYAVRMREFPQDALASALLSHCEFGAADIDVLAAKVAAFHAKVQVATPDSPFGRPDDVLRIALQNFSEILPSLATPSERVDLDTVARWTEREYNAHYPAFCERKRGGFIRECHGDLHLGNIARIDGEITIFDCIEFNDAMRWIDVMSEVAFTVMDLQDRGRADLGQRFLNAYLEITGDYAGLSVLRFYLAYRAMVRAKVARLRAAQLGASTGSRAQLDEYRGYVNLARSWAQPSRGAIVLTHGLSGSGKSTLSQPLLEALGAVRIRTDIERKRLHLRWTRETSAAGIDRGLYAPDATQATYQHVCSLARRVVAAGHVAVVDATFIKRWQRDLFRKLASDLQVPFVIVTFVASESTLRERIARRAIEGHDASDADLTVLDHQLQMQEPLAPEECAEVVVYDSEAPLERAHAAASWRRVVDRIATTDHCVADATARASVDPGLGAKVAFLSLPASYPEPTTQVETVETHLSWVFLTDRYAWKLKKPVRSPVVDFTTVTARRLNCDEELRLNRRLSDDVYLEIVPLSLDVGGCLRFRGEGEPIDWLVKMRRLPKARMLDRLILNGAATHDDVRRVISRLARFYRDAPPVDIACSAYRDAFAKGIAGNLRELCAPAYGLPAKLIAAIAMQQQNFLEHRSALFDERNHAGHVVEAHGDLRPEHICLEDEPQIIDCLEFSRELRILDPADELAFLALECERLGAPAFTTAIFETYTVVTGDVPPVPLLAFYRSYRACVRAKLAIWHLNDPQPREPSKWVARAHDYLQLASRDGALVA